MRQRIKQARRAQVIALAAIVIASAVAGVVWLNRVDGNSDAGQTAHDRERAGFAVLSAANTNRCDLAAAEVRWMRDGMRLQGSCCTAMDRSSYRAQLGGLRSYARRERGLVPVNPYDVPVDLAKRLLAYRTITLDARQQATYDRARGMSDLGGPCCCRCWRWQAFDGQARFLIARRHYSASQVAQVWDLEEGCGGRSTTAT